MSSRTARAMIVVIIEYGISGISRLFVLQLRRFLACASLFLAFCCASPAQLNAETPHAEEPKGVLVLYKDDTSVPGELAADKAYGRFWATRRTSRFTASIWRLLSSRIRSSKRHS